MLWAIPFAWMALASLREGSAGSADIASLLPLPVVVPLVGAVVAPLAARLSGRGQGFTRGSWRLGGRLSRRHRA